MYAYDLADVHLIIIMHLLLLSSSNSEGGQALAGRIH